MKKALAFIIMTSIVALAACSNDYHEAVDVFDLNVVLTNGDEGTPLSGARVELRSIGRDAIFVDTTDTQGTAHFAVPAGIYQASSAYTNRSGVNTVEIANATSGQFVVGNEEGTATINIKMSKSRLSQLVIKGLYNGGIKKEDGTAFHYDKSFIIYNNTSVRASYSNLCVGIGTPYNSQANNKWYDGNGHLSYEAEGYMPAIDGIWYFPQTLTIEPYQQVVVNCHGAIDNTQTYPESVNYAKADYYCMYDPEAGYVNVNYYPTPASIIPTDHYLKAAKIGLSNAWALSNSSPALFLFQVPDVTPLQFASNTSNMTYTPGSAQTDVNKVVKVPIDWIIDAIEVFAASYKSSNTKRLPASVDAGYVELTNQLGHTLYRNVDKAATEALPENEGKLVYNYAMSVQPDAEPSKIDAEASIKNGAHIVYMDTNNSTADFHERLTSSLKQ